MSDGAIGGSLSIRVIPSDKLYVSEPNPISFGNEPNPGYIPPFWTYENWLRSLFHFSFGPYESTSNERFGVLRVVNDDTVMPERGFATHGHRDMEIITYVVEGELTHEDSMGNAETLTRGSIQYMTAGTGVEHSEHNKNETRPMRCIQTWILPSEYGLQPRYGSYSPPPSSPTSCRAGDARWENKFKHLATSVQNPADVPVKICQDIDCYVAELELGAQVVLPIPVGRMAYMVCIEGGVSVAVSPQVKSSSLADDVNQRQSVVSISSAPIISCSSQHYQLKKFDGCEITQQATHAYSSKKSTDLDNESPDNNDGSSNYTDPELSITATDTEPTQNGELAHVIVFLLPTMAEYAGRKDF